MNMPNKHYFQQGRTADLDSEVSIYPGGGGYDMQTANGPLFDTPVSVDAIVGPRMPWLRWLARWARSARQQAGFPRRRGP
ncbi:hypothetical protein [Pseudoduganella plicata]|uniref:Uncharacterized protein n=1 Tax=Pseudoduganella plicata TaxID=321984 RepID=A0A4V1AU50_9BURK|nr:hypothetical protein [Pseudoduganella plicata]QBQ37938.1 hypothetical protein E1742_18445 [Pseudoduganella plicata]GGZ04284.1 hypothetical protein GCM10007388_42540 [Pseudoduganella plicata]